MHEAHSCNLNLAVRTASHMYIAIKISRINNKKRRLNRSDWLDIQVFVTATVGTPFFALVLWGLRLWGLRLGGLHLGGFHLWSLHLRWCLMFRRWQSWYHNNFIKIDRLGRGTQTKKPSTSPIPQQLGELIDPVFAGAIPEAADKSPNDWRPRTSRRQGNNKQCTRI